ncbi:MAG TPA: hypothetical protein VFM77_03700 [Terriglobales bacterium]|nr:hypothetical protein [Terriglobales bacterium]
MRQNTFRNVDVIKITLGGDISVPELTAAVEEAHRQHLKIAAHAIDVASIQTAIDSDVDSIEHGNQVTNEQLKQMHDKGTFLDPTMPKPSCGPRWRWRSSGTTTSGLAI